MFSDKLLTWAKHEELTPLGAKRKQPAKGVRFESPWQVGTGREEIDAIIDSYGRFSEEGNKDANTINKRRQQEEKAYRNFEKAVARQHFKTWLDWEDIEKISEYLKATARKTK